MATPPSFNWVTARAECTPHRMLFRLLAGVRKDVETRNAQREPGEFRLSVEDSSVDEFTVIRESSDGVQRVRFFIDKAGISVSGDNRVAFHATMQLDGGGDCLLHDEEEDGSGRWMSEWMFRQRALDRLFFG